MKFSGKFLGCKVSQADLTLAKQHLLETGHEESTSEPVDVAVINTCCITREAEAKSRQAVRRALKTADKVYVSGCAVNLNSTQFADISPNVEAFVGTADDVALQMAEGLGACVDLEHDLLLNGSSTVATAGRTRGFVKVQDGCDCHCAYCIIPTVRGSARSRSAEAVLTEVRKRVERGQPEMVMTGISVGDYRDQETGMELGDLMVAAAQVPGVERVRLSSVEVIHVRDSLLEALRDEPKVCPHLHLPMQSGDDRVLHAMGRHYTAAEYLAAVAAVRAEVPQINITADVIVGFPGEDEQAFMNTLELVKQAGITRVHAFSYSPRPGTKAEALGDLVAPEEKKDRSRRLRGLSEVLSRQHRTAKLGSLQDVLIDKSADIQVSGYTADYTRYYLPPETGRTGEIVRVSGHEIYSDGVKATPVGAVVAAE